MKKMLIKLLKLFSGFGLVYWLTTWLGILPYDKNVKGAILLCILIASVVLDITIRVAKRRKKHGSTLPENQY